MPRRVVIPDRIVIDIREPVPGLHALRLERHHRIWLDKSAQQAVVPPGAHLVQLNAIFQPLPSEKARERWFEKIDLPY
jgi:hypothetical protein